MKINAIYAKILRPFRTKRMKRFLETFDITPDTTILDVGGTPYNWLLANCPAKIKLLNLQLPSALPDLPQNITYVQGNGTNLQFEDRSFDIVFSNSVIEHLYTLEQQKIFAQEIRRVGKHIWVQTPAHSFFFEPHYLTPFFHYLPKPMQAKLARNFTVWGWLTRPSAKYAVNMVNEIRLLSFLEFQLLFKDCSIQREKFLGMTKSYVAISK